MFKTDPFGSFEQLAEPLGQVKHVILFFVKSMDLQVDLRRTLDAELEAYREPDRAQDVELNVVGDTPPLVYPQNSPLSTADGTDADINFSEGLPALPPDNDELLSGEEFDADDPCEDDLKHEEDTAVISQPESLPTPLVSQIPWRARSASPAVASIGGECIAPHRWSSYTVPVRWTPHTRQLLLHIYHPYPQPQRRQPVTPCSSCTGQ